MKYRPEIDGLRTIAVVPVIFFHAGFGLFSGGFVGVDIFFAISGYLITMVLIEDLENGRFSIMNFYERRARRILPALFLVMACSIPFAWMWMLPEQMTDFAHSLIAVSLFVSNILFWQESGYFAPAAEQKPLLHTWSLAVEEQYYLFFPVFLFLVWRFGKDRVFWMIVILATFSLLLTELGWRRAPSANFYLAPTRAWEIFAGSIAAFIVRKQGVRENQLLSMIGLMAITGSIFLYDPETPFPSVYALMPVLGTVLIVLFGGTQTFVARLLSTRVMVGIGLISYSAYLWHQPLLAFARVRTIHEPPLILMGALGLLSIGIAYLCWKYVERPFRAGAKPIIRERNGIFAASVMGLCAFIAVGFAVRDGVPDRFQRWYDPETTQLTLPLMADGYCFRDFQVSPELDVQTELPDCRIGQQNVPSRGLVFGDSLAAQWEPFLDAFGKDNDLAFDVLTTNWCFPTFANDFTAKRGHIAGKQCQLNRDFVRKAADRYDFIVLSGQWYRVVERGYTSGVTAMISELLTTTRARLVLIDTPPLYERNSVERAYYWRGSDLILNDRETELAAAFWKEASTQFGANNRILLLQPKDFGDDFARAGYTKEGIPYSLDGTHISVHASLELYRENENLLGPMLKAFLSGGFDS